MAALNDTQAKIGLIDILRVFHPKAAEYTYFSMAHRTFSRIDHMLGHKTSLNKFKEIEIISSIFSDHIGMKLEINYRKKTPEKHTKMWKLNYMSLNNEQVNNHIQEEIKRYPETNENENTTLNLWDTGTAILRGKFPALQF